MPACRCVIHKIMLHCGSSLQTVSCIYKINSQVLYSLKSAKSENVPSLSTMVTVAFLLLYTTLLLELLRLSVKVSESSTSPSSKIPTSWMQVSELSEGSLSAIGNV